MKLLIPALMLVMAGTALAAPSDSEGWISHPAVVTSSTQPKGMGCITEVKVMGMADSSTMRRNMTR